jgi:hypothetical protein
MTWVIVFVVLGVLALVAIGACALPVWREGKALIKQLGTAAKTLGEASEPLTGALDQMGAAQGSAGRHSSVRR